MLRVPVRRAEDRLPLPCTITVRGRAGPFDAYGLNLSRSGVLVELTNTEGVIRAIQFGQLLSDVQRLFGTGANLSFHRGKVVTRGELVRVVAAGDKVRIAFRFPTRLTRAAFACLVSSAI